jgi:hypothetical protein
LSPEALQKSFEENPWIKKDRRMKKFKKDKIDPYFSLK